MSAALLEIHAARKRFGGVAAVDGVSFDVRHGEFVSLIGPNGAGKTSVFNLITSAYVPDSGEIRLEGHALAGMTISAIARLGVARTFQTLQVFGGMRAIDNVVAALEARGVHTAQAYDQARQLLAEAGLAGQEQAQAQDLSFGQQRLLELARALATKPKLLLLDEPASGLSRIEVAALIRQLRRLRASGLTILMIEHDLRTVMAESDRVVVLHRGMTLATGAPAEVQQNPDVVAAYLGESDERPRRTVSSDRRQLLAVEDLVTYRGDVRALDGATLDVHEGELLAIVGANGAGKSTLLGTLAGLYAPRSGRITYQGQPIHGLSAEQVVRRGIALVPERRHVFEDLTVARNLEVGAYSRRGKSAAELDLVYTLFPRLKERTRQRAGTLSGGEQQMLAIGRGLLAKPSLLLLDEPSLGLAPRVVAEIFDALDAVRRDGTTIVLVEQNALAALPLADRFAVIERGRVASTGNAADLASDEGLAAAYLGKGEPEALPIS
ncbi:ATP-binding cassette domain-containing protein [bacterium]|nr:MAG: ATP-binding cassette domain-containing protein [bacterium]